MNHLRDLLRSAARFPPAGLDESVLARRATRRRRRRATVVASTSAVAIALLVGLVAVAAGAGHRGARSQVEIFAGSSAPSEETVASGGANALIRPTRATSVPDSTAPSSAPLITAAQSKGIVAVPAPTPDTTAPSKPTESTYRTTTTMPSPILGTGVAGTVSAGPTCPVEPAPDGCPPSPLTKTTVQALDSSETVVASDTTDLNGNFGIRVAPGVYTLHVVTSGRFPACEDVKVTVNSDSTSRADIHCDTGIR